MKNKVTIVLSWCLVFLVMFIIFQFSAENSEKSTQTSGGVVKEILEIVMDKEEVTPQVVKKYQIPTRKLAHFGIYMLLGFCVINAFKVTVNKKIQINLLLSVLFSLLYAISDEIHQNFSNGRGPSVVDVLIDLSGAVVGILMFIAMTFLFNKMLKKK